MEFRILDQERLKTQKCTKCSKSFELKDRVYFCVCEFHHEICENNQEILKSYMSVEKIGTGHHDKMTQCLICHKYGHKCCVKQHFKDKHEQLDFKDMKKELKEMKIDEFLKMI